MKEVELGALTAGDRLPVKERCEVKTKTADPKGWHGYCHRSQRAWA